MFDLDARVYWTPLTNMDEFEDNEDDGLGGITQGMRQMNWQSEEGSGVAIVTRDQELAYCF